jgi:hypothetical protein
VAAAAGLTLACLSVELLAYRSVRSVDRLVEARMADLNRPQPTLRELESLIGRRPESRTEDNGFIVATYSWQRLVRTYTLRLECATWAGDDPVVLTYDFQ